MADNKPISYKFLRATAFSDTEIVTQRQQMRHESSSLYQKLGVATKSYELAKATLSLYARMESVIGFEVKSKIVEVEKESKLLTGKKKSAVKTARLIVLSREEKALRERLASEQNEYAAVYEDLHNVVAKLDTFRQTVILSAKKMEEEMEATFNRQRQARTAIKTKKVEEAAKATDIVLTPAEVKAAAEDEGHKKSADKKKNKKSKAASAVVRKDQLSTIPSAFKPIE